MLGIFRIRPCRWGNSLPSPIACRSSNVYGVCVCTVWMVNRVYADIYLIAPELGWNGSNVMVIRLAAFKFKSRKFLPIADIRPPDRLKEPVGFMPAVNDVDTGIIFQ